jgi:hypothetical protein
MCVKHPEAPLKQGGRARKWSWALHGACRGLSTAVPTADSPQGGGDEI